MLTSATKKLSEMSFTSTDSTEESLNLTLIDFNVAKKFKDPTTANRVLMHTTTGAPAYSAPEVRKHQSYK